MFRRRRPLGLLLCSRINLRRLVRMVVVVPKTGVGMGMDRARFRLQVRLVQEWELLSRPLPSQCPVPSPKSPRLPQRRPIIRLAQLQPSLTYIPDATQLYMRLPHIPPSPPPLYRLLVRLSLTVSHLSRTTIVSLCIRARRRLSCNQGRSSSSRLWSIPNNLRNTQGVY